MFRAAFVRDIIHPLKIRSQRQCISRQYSNPGVVFWSRRMQRARRTRFDSPRIGYGAIVGSSGGRNLLFYHCPDGAHIDTRGPPVCALYGSMIYRKSYVSRATDILRFYVPVFQITVPYPAFAASTFDRKIEQENRQVDVQFEAAFELRRISPRSLAARNAARFRLRRETFYIIDPLRVAA